MAQLLLAILFHILSNIVALVAADSSNPLYTSDQNNALLLNPLPKGSNESTGPDMARGLDVSCNQYIYNFSISSSSFVQCATSHAKPVKLCEKCSGQYREVISVADDVEQDKSCSNQILNSDVLRIVQTTHKFVTDLWKNGQCDRCYRQESSSEGRPMYDEFSNETVNFLALYNDTLECFNNSQSAAEVFEVDVDNPVCRHCNGPYCKLNGYYESMGAASTICMDVVEMMNSTRHIWSEDFKCIKHKKDLKVVVSVSAVLSCLPIFFYLASKLLSTKKVITREDLSKSGGSQDEQHYISTFGANRR